MTMDQLQQLPAVGGRRRPAIRSTATPPVEIEVDEPGAPLGPGHRSRRPAWPSGEADAGSPLSMGEGRLQACRSLHSTAICSDGDLRRGGISHEGRRRWPAHLGLGNLIFFYDDNHISIEGETAALVVLRRIVKEALFDAYGWHTLAHRRPRPRRRPPKAIRKGPEKSTDRPDDDLRPAPSSGFGSAESTTGHGPAPTAEPARARDEVKATKRSARLAAGRPTFSS